MRQYAVSRDTVRRALAKLESEGYLKRKAAAGTFVRIEKADYGLSRMESFSEQMLRRGLSPSSELPSIQLTADLPAPVRKELGFTGAERAYIISRLRKANGQPMAHEVAYIPCALCPDLHTHLVESHLAVSHLRGYLSPAAGQRTDHAGGRNAQPGAAKASAPAPGHARAAHALHHAPERRPGAATM